MSHFTVVRDNIFLIAISILTSTTAWTQDRDFAVVGVSVIPMDVERLLENQTVVVRDGVIESVRDTATTAISADLRQIDGSGRYLFPGLADLHVHIRNEDELTNYLTWGVTTVMHLGGSGQSGKQQLAYRDEIKSGQRSGPNIYTTNRTLDGDPAVGYGAHSVSTGDQARRIVRELKAGGFDFIKIYNNVSLPVFNAIVAEGRAQGLSVIGHIPRAFDPVTALSGGQAAVAHTEELFFTYFGGPRSTRDMPQHYEPDLDRLPALIQVLKDNHVALMPDLAFTFGNFLMWDDVLHYSNDPEYQYLHPDTADGWHGGGISRRAEIENFMLREQWKYDLMQTLTLEFQKEGILQVIGTDASIPGLFPGKAAHRELTELVKVGFSNFDALSAGTKNAGEFVRRHIDPATRFGQISPGYRADFILLDKNPLDDVRNVRLIRGVAVAGRYTGKSTLDQRREAIKARYDRIRSNSEVLLN